MKNKLNISNARTPEQKRRMEKAISEKLCPFCGAGLKVIHKKLIIKKTTSLFLTESAFPYEGTSHHYLIVSKKHTVDLTKISSKVWGEVGTLTKFAIKKYKIDGGSMFLRFGEMHKNGSTIDHIHWHLISGNSSEKEKEENREAVRVKLGYKKKTT
jgi:diadenosine tetraphosphate (Ap4A) HIT family hydrolase